MIDVQFGNWELSVAGEQRCGWNEQGSVSVKVARVFAQTKGAIYYYVVISLRKQIYYLLLQVFS